MNKFNRRTQSTLRQVLDSRSCEPLSSRSLRPSVINVSVVAGFLLFFTSVANAHHIRGIPHYSYQENYPQAPAFEEFRESGPWSLQFTYWQIPAQTALDLALYVKRLDTGKPYTGAVTIQVFKQGEDETSDINHPFDAYANPRNIHKVGWVYEESGLYIVKVDLGEGSEKISERFTLQVGTVPLNFWYLGGIAIGLIGLMVAVAILKKRIDPDPSADVELE